MDFQILKQLCLTPSPSGYEDKLIKYICALKLKNFTLSKSKVNSCTLSSKTKLDKTVLLDSHIDQVHLRVIRNDKSGYVVAKPLGFKSSVLFGNIIQDLSGEYTGVVSTLPPHLRIDKTTKDTKNDVCYIDFGMKKKELDKIFYPGDPLIYNLHFTPIGQNYISACALDNKACVFIMIELLKYFDDNIDKLNHNIIFHFSSREEVGLGSFSDIDTKNIDNIFVLDTPIGSDSPLISPDLIGDISLSNGVVITRNIDDNISLGNKLIEIAEKNKIKYQREFSYGKGGTNNMHYSKFNSAFSQALGPPVRNMHSPAEVVNKNDIRATFKLMKIFLSK